MPFRLPINFFSEQILFNLKQKTLLREWINQTIIAEGFILTELNFIFSDDEYLLNINKEYLKHDAYTDIITFDTSNQEKAVQGDIFISIDRIKENARTFKVSVKDELHRVMIHGTLHLLGYADKGKQAKQLMTTKEDLYLAARRF